MTSVESVLNPHKIIVRMPNWLGDAVMATPVLVDLRLHFPTAEITVMCQGNIAPLIKEDPYIDEIFTFQRVSGWIHQTHRGDLIESLQLGGYDLGILLTNSFSSAWWFWRGQVKERLGYATHFRSWLLTQPIPFPDTIETQHLVFTYKILLRSLGIPISDTPPKLYVTEEELAAARVLLSEFNITEKDTIIGINPGAAYGTAKCWLPDRFKELTLRLIEEPHVKVVFFGDRMGAPVVDGICTDMPPSVVNLANKTNLRELMALIKLCKVLVTNDSGPMHIAAALGTPPLALFGSTSDIKTGPYMSGKVIHKHVECSPCYKRICPIDFRCMKRIEVAEVYQELQKLIKS